MQQPIEPDDPTAVWAIRVLIVLMIVVLALNIRG